MRKIPGEGKEEKPSEEELLIPTFVQKEGRRTRKTGSYSQ